MDVARLKSQTRPRLAPRSLYGPIPGGLWNAWNEVYNFLQGWDDFVTTLILTLKSPRHVPLVLMPKKWPQWRKRTSALRAAKWRQRTCNGTGGTPDRISLRILHREALSQADFGIPHSADNQKSRHERSVDIRSHRATPPWPRRPGI